MKLIKKSLTNRANSLVGFGICRILSKNGYVLFGTYNTNKIKLNNKI